MLNAVGYVDLSLRHDSGFVGFQFSDEMRGSKGRRW